jgi:hypothetical protein
MKARVRQASEYVLAATLLGFAVVANGQGFDAPDPVVLAKQIASQKALVSGWEARADWVFGLGMLVVVLGATVAVLQKFEAKKWCSYSVGVIGIAISALTFTTKEYFDADYKTYKKSAVSAKRDLDEAERLLDDLNRKDVDLENRRNLADEIAKKISRVQALEDSIVGIAAQPGTPVKGAGVTTLIATAHAQPLARPPWVSQPRTENATAFRFVGTGQASSLAAAQATSLQDAQRNAAEGLTIPLASVRRYARLIDTYTEYDSAQRIYRYYTLIELNRALVPR